MKFSKRKSTVLIIIIGILLIFSLNFFQKEVKNFFYLVSSPIQKWLWNAGMKISDFCGTISEIKNLKKENEELKLNIQELLAEIVFLKELKKENETLREALNLGLEKEFKLTLTEVVGKDISQDLLIVNKGLKDGVTMGLPVITQQKALIGKIKEVYENSSKVMLISDKESSFDAKISDTETYGVVKGKGNFKLYLDLVPKDKEIKEGDLLVTSALGGVFPKGLLVGQIKEVNKSDVEPLQKAEISSFLDIKELKYLFIIREW